MTDTSHDIRTLNGLIATTIDSIDGYTEAAKDAENGRFTAMFTSRATERRAAATLPFTASVALVFLGAASAVACAVLAIDRNQRS